MASFFPSYLFSSVPTLSFPSCLLSSITTSTYHLILSSFLHFPFLFIFFPLCLPFPTFFPPFLHFLIFFPPFLHFPFLLIFFPPFLYFLVFFPPFLHFPFLLIFFPPFLSFLCCDCVVHGREVWTKVQMCMHSKKDIVV